MFGSERRRHHISVAGNIGAGKSSLVQILAQEFGWQPYYELVGDHPYLEDYYKDMARWGFHAQIYFLAQRYEQHQEIADTPISVVQDRSMYEDYEIFVKGLLEQGILSPRDFHTYRKLYLALIRTVAPPTLLIYLRASVPTLLERIRQRDRGYEREIPPEYLDRLNQRYEDWMKRFNLCPVLTFDCDRLDFVNREEDRKRVLDVVRRALGE